MRTTSPSTQDQSHPAGVISLVIQVDIDVNQLALLGKSFFWDKPSSCPKCGGHLWWHGFVLAYLACLGEAVFFRRLYCPHCAPSTAYGRSRTGADSSPPSRPSSRPLPTGRTTPGGGPTSHDLANDNGGAGSRRNLSFVLACPLPARCSTLS